jgi:ribonucleoside-diphosphate reductase alpha chain
MDRAMTVEQDHFPLSENARTVLARRYLKRDAEGVPVESPADLFHRVARGIARGDRAFDPEADVEKTAEAFLEIIRNGRFMPNSPTLMNAGRRLGQLAACFVLPIDDDMESIFDTLKHTAVIHKSGGGTGFSFSRIRPKNDVVLSTAGISSGPVSFMTVYDTATETVKQGGTRRGANMAVLRVDHPDIEDFIRIKDDPTKLNNFNISVALTRTFMDALKANGEYDLINPRTGEAAGRASAKKIFSEIADAAWRTGEPGILFLDRINAANPTPHLGAMEATNPCGEAPLLPYESCVLGSVNLSRMVRNGALDRDRLRTTVHRAVHFLDNVIEVNRYPLDAIAETTRRTRKIGVGVMGFADMLIRMGIRYDSEEAAAMAGEVMGFLSAEARAASAELGRSRGNFPAYGGSRFDGPETPRMRNAAVTTIAPTGTISLIAGASSGVEPLFAVAHARHVLEGRRLFDIHPLFVEMATEAGIYSEALAAAVSETGSVQGMAAVPERIQRLFKTAHEIPPEWHVRIQAAFQKHTDNAVSKTINFPASATSGDVAAAFKLADRIGCKGITIYRDRSRRDQVLRVGPEGAATAAPSLSPRPRPEVTQGVTRRIRTGCGNLYVTVNSDPDGLCEVFARTGKTGGCAASQIEAVGRLISLALRSGIGAEGVIKQLSGIRCPSPAWQNGRMTLSCSDAVARVLREISGDEGAESINGMDAGGCPDCGGRLVSQSGCLVCGACGFSRCG